MLHFPDVHQITLVLLAILCRPNCCQSPADLQPGFQTYRVGDEEWLVVQMRDALSGRSLSGAAIDFVDEHLGQMPQDVWSFRKSTANELGVLRMRIDDLPGRGDGGWFFFSAPGYASRACFGLIPVDVTMELAPSQPWKVRFVRWDGEPMAHVSVGATFGCGHTPDMEQHKTSELSEVVWMKLRSSMESPEIYVVSDGVKIGPYFATKVGQEFVVICEASRTRTGRLLEAEKVKSWQGCVVGARGPHRGPWTPVGDDGSFRLVGSPLDRPLVLKRPGSHDLLNLDGSDGGEWRVIAEAKEPPKEVIATKVVQLRIEGSLGRSVALHQYDRTGKHDFQWKQGFGDIPVCGPGVLQIDSDTVTRLHVYTGKEDEIRIAWPAPLRVRARVVDADGRVVDGTCHIEKLLDRGGPAMPDMSFHGGELELSCPFEEPMFLVLRSENGQADLLFVEHGIRGGLVDLGTVQLDARVGLGPGTVRVGASGPGPGNLSVGWKREGVTGPNHTVSLDVAASESQWKSALLKRGDWVVYRASSGKGVVGAERRVRVEIDGVVAGAGAVGIAELVVVDPRIAPEGNYSLVVDGNQSWLEGTSTAVHIPGGGEIDVVVGAKDGRCARRRIRVPAGGVERFEFELK